MVFYPQNINYIKVIDVCASVDKVLNPIVLRWLILIPDLRIGRPREVLADVSCTIHQIKARYNYLSLNLGV